MSTGADQAAIARDPVLFFSRAAALIEPLGPDEMLAMMLAAASVGCPRCQAARAFFVLRRRDDTWTYLCVLCDRDHRNPQAA